MAGYSSAFVKYYDAHMGDYTKQHALLKQLINTYHPKGKKLLELACGSGNVLIAFQKTHQLSGLDISQDMLKLAKKKVPNAKLTLGDMSNFHLKENFDIIICFYDSINHLANFTQWKDMFRLVSKHLNPGGIFIFDINTLERMTTYAKRPILVTKKNDIISTLKVKQLGKHKFKSRFQIITASEKNTLSCIDEYVHEVCYEQEKITKALKKDFTVEEIVDPLQRKPSKKSKILVFACRKKSSQ